MRILHIDDLFFPTAGYQLDFLAKYNSLNGNDVYIICSDSAGSWRHSGFINEEYFKESDNAYTEKYGVKIIRLKSKLYISGRAVMSIREIIGKINEIRPDIILVHGNDTLTAINILMNIGKIKYPIIMDSHMLDAASKNRLRKIFRAFYRKFITPVITKNQIWIIGVDPECSRFANANYGIPYDNLETIPLGYDPDIFYKADNGFRQELRKKYGFDEHDFIFIYTGKISPDKKVHLLIDAFKDKLVSDTKKAALIIVGGGSGEYFEKLKEDIKTSENKIVLFPTQPVEMLNDFYNLSDAAIWPGASSLSMLDAQACGLPVIAEGLDINISRLSSGNGFTYRIDSIDDLRNKIEYIFNMPVDKLCKISENAVSNVSANYSYKIISKKFEDLMELEIRKYGN